MIHDRHFSREEADALLPALAPLLTELRKARDELTDEQVHGALADAAPANGGGSEGRHVGEAFLRVRRILGELTATGVVVRDIDRGLIDFPALSEGREIYLCWHLGEDSVGHWHELEDGIAGRRPLDPGQA